MKIGTFCASDYRMPRLFYEESNHLRLALFKTSARRPIDSTAQRFLSGLVSQKYVQKGFFARLAYFELGSVGKRKDITFHFLDILQIDQIAAVAPGEAFIDQFLFQFSDGAVLLIGSFRCMVPSR